MTLSFATFLDEIEDNFYDGHTSHQHLFLSKKNLKLTDMDFIILFEELESDLKIFERNFPVTLPNRNFHRKKADKKNILHHFIDTHPQIQNKIYHLWEEDFKFYEEAKKIRNNILSNMKHDI